MDYDLIVFGGGNAITVATETARAGWKVALVEKGPLGGTCPNRGCIPSKLLLAHADVATAVRGAGRFHVEASIESIDVNAILQDVKGYIDGFDDRIGSSLPDTLTHVREHGRFLDDHTVQAGDMTLRAPRIVLATGSRPRRPELPGVVGTPYWTSDDVFRQERAPRSITIVGGGFIGCELAHFFHGVGVDTLLVHRDADLLGREDGEIRAVFQEAFTARVPTRLESNVANGAYDGDRFRLEIVGADGQAIHRESEALLFAIGRVPNTDDIGLETTSLPQADERGYVRSDDRLRTGIDGIWSLGDVAGLYSFTHAANTEAQYLARALLEESDEPIAYGRMPHAVFTSPEVAGAGDTEEELVAAGTPYAKGVVSYDGASKGRAIKEEHGRAKILVGADGTILGCHIVGEHASILLHEVIPVMKWRNHISSLTGIIHVHPSLPEVVRGAARSAEAAWKERF